MDPTEIEQNILNAVGVIRHVHQETNALLSALDDALAGQGWQSLNKNWLGLWKTGAQLNYTANWLATTLNRAYGHSGKPRLVILVEIYLAPADGGPPVVAVSGLSLVEKAKSSDLWSSGDNWKWEASNARPWFSGAEADGAIDTDAMRRVVGIALHGRGLLVPLCGIDKTNVTTLLVEPALDLIRSVPLD